MKLIKRANLCILTKELILSHVPETAIIQAFWPPNKELKWNRAIISPFRDENQESFLIGNKYGPITYKDLGDYNYRGDVWKFVQQIERLQTFDQVLKAIDQRLNLGYSKDKIEGRKIEYKVPKIEIVQPPVIQVTTRKFNKDELRYWASYYQDITDLQREEIYAPKEIYRNRIKLVQTEMTFCYYCKDIGKWKLYRPLAPKKVKNSPPWLWKWDNSIGTLQYVEGLDKMKGPIGICTKSRKDRMVTRKITGIDAICSVQAEDPAALTDEALYTIWENCKNKYILADSDKKGKEFSWWMCKEHGYKHINTPDWALLNGVNDIADMARVYGIEEARKLFIEKGILSK